MKKFLENAEILQNEAIIPDVWKMVFHAPKIAAEAKPGQFVNMQKQGGKTFLRRPFGIVDADTETLPTFGPSGRQERLNCCAKNLQ